MFHKYLHGLPFAFHPLLSLTLFFPGLAWKKIISVIAGIKAELPQLPDSLSREKIKAVHASLVQTAAGKQDLFNRGCFPQAKTGAGISSTASSISVLISFRFMGCHFR